jgi:hypothetical protein
MLSKTQRFNCGFGVNMVKPSSERRRDIIQAKALLSVPLLGCFLSVVLFKDRTVQRKIGLGAAGLRGILYGSIVGIPVGVALDIVGMITQVKALVQAKRKARVRLLDRH